MIFTIRKVVLKQMISSEDQTCGDDMNIVQHKMNIDGVHMILRWTV